MAEKLNKMILGNRIRIIRGYLGQIEFAKELGIKRNTASAYENNSITPSGKVLLKLYKKFNVNINWLLSGEGDPYLKIELENKIEKMESRIKTLEKQVAELEQRH